jgi:integrase
MKLQEFYTSVYRPRIQDLRECTRVGYESAWTLHIEQQLGDVDMSLLGSEIVGAWLKGFEKPGAAKKSWAVLRAMLKLARKKGFDAPDPATLDVTIPKPAHYIPKLLEIGEIRTLLKGFYGHQLEAWLIASATLGLRPEEALALEWTDIDLRSGIVHIERGLQWVDGHESINPPKTELSRRDLPLPRFAVLRLRELKKHWRFTMPRALKTKRQLLQGTGRNRLIGELTPPQVAREYKRWCQQNHLPYVPARNLRHSWATTHLKAGVDISIVSKFLGHASIATTAKFYLVPDLGIMRDAQRAWEKQMMQTAA